MLWLIYTVCPIFLSAHMSSWRRLSAVTYWLLEACVLMLRNAHVRLPGQSFQQQFVGEQLPILPL